jgi:pimeloyl-ACP methyl ester carboxylesterase
MSHLLDMMDYHGQFDVIGYHTGAMIGPELAILRSDRIRRLIMISAPIFTADERVQMRNTYRHLEPQLDGSHLTAQWKSMIYWNLHGPATLETIAELFPEKLAARRQADWGHMAAFAYPLADRLPLVRQPILVLNPKDDMRNNTQRVSALLNNGRLLDLPGWGHGFLALHASEAADMVRSFLDAPNATPFDLLKAPADALIERDLPTWQL